MAELGLRIPFLRTFALASVLALAALAAGLAGARPAHAASPILVNSTHDAVHDSAQPDNVCAAAEAGGPCTLRAAVFVANHTSGAVVTVPAGEFKLDLGQLELDKPMTIHGAGVTTIINAQKLSRAFLVRVAPSNGAVTLRDMTITNGVDLIGGGIANAGSALRLVDVSVDNNTALAGGGVFNFGSLNVASGFVTNNTALEFGGGIFNFIASDLDVSLSPTGKGTEFGNNTAGELGGGVLDSGHATITQAEFVFNHAGTANGLSLFGRSGTPFGAGGGLAVTRLIRFPDEMRDAVATPAEAALAPALSTELAAATTWARVGTSTFNDNSASVAGGGVAVLGRAALDMQRSTLWQNSAAPFANFPVAVAGGGLANVLGRVRLVNDTFNANVANGSNVPRGGLGGAIVQVGFQPRVAIAENATVDNAILKLPHVTSVDEGDGDDRVADMGIDLTTIAGNIAQDGIGGGIFRLSGTLEIANTILASNVAENNPGTANCAGVPAAASDGYNLESANTCSFSAAKHDQISTNPLLGALGNNGGPTQTMALSAGSPAIDTANPNCPVNASEKTDERGVTRPQGAACDIGAYEFIPQQSTPSPSATPTTLPSPPATGTGTGLGSPANRGPLAALLAALVALAAAGAGLVLKSGRA